MKKTQVSENLICDMIQQTKVSLTFCLGEGGGGNQGEAREVIGGDVNKGGDGALPQVEGELASSTTDELLKVDEEMGDAMISNQQSVEEKTKVDGNLLLKTKRGQGPRLLMPLWLREKRQLLSTPTSGDTSDPLKFVEVHLCDSCDMDFDRRQDLTTHEKRCGMKEVPKSLKPVVFALHIVFFSGGLLGGRVNTTASFSCKQLQALLQKGKSSLCKEAEGWSKAKGQ